MAMKGSSPSCGSQPPFTHFPFALSWQAVCGQAVPQRTNRPLTHVFAAALVTLSSLKSGSSPILFRDHTGTVLAYSVLIPYSAACRQCTLIILNPSSIEKSRDCVCRGNGAPVTFRREPDDRLSSLRLHQQGTKRKNTSSRSQTDLFADTHYFWEALEVKDRYEPEEPKAGEATS
jgi:hypothetical protein